MFNCFFYVLLLPANQYSPIWSVKEELGPNIENKTRVVCRNLILCLALLCISLFFGPYHDGVVSLTLFGKAMENRLVVSVLFWEEDCLLMIDEQNSRVIIGDKKRRSFFLSFWLAFMVPGTFTGYLTVLLRWANFLIHNLHYSHISIKQNK